jgi:cysteine desulfurase
MAANNEIGTFQPYLRIGEIARARGILFHSDAIQAIAFRQWDLSELPVDLISIAPHKFYGPKGIGILYVKEGIDLIPSLTGGGQEDGRRAGTVNVPFAVGAAAALELAFSERTKNIAHYNKLVGRLIGGILSNFGDDCTLTGHPSDRLPNHASFAFRDLSGNDLIRYLDTAGISASSGSACLTGDPQPSVVLQALGLDERWTRGGLRLTVGRQNTMDDIDYTIATLSDVVDRIRKLDAIFAS